MLLIFSAIDLGSVNIGRTRGRISRKRGDFCIWASKKRKDFNGILGINDDDDLSVVGSLIPEPDPICQSIHIPFQFSESSECLFKSKMRIPKRFSFSSNSTLVSVTLFSPSPEFLLYSHPAYRIPRFQSRVFVSKFSDCFLNRKRRFLWPTDRDCPVRYINTMAGIAANVRSSQFEGIDGAKSDKNPSILSSRGYSEIAIGKKIFCNRSLNMKSIAAVGFDMDYTLAQYIPATFESLAYEGTVSKLVHDLGYPQELLKWTFDWKYMVRGLVIDKKRGNILKMDRHKYVKVAYHGFREMSKEEKVAAYGNNLVRDSFDEPDYGLIDTLFSLGAAYLFAQLVNFKDENPRKFPEGTDYSRIFKDIVFAMDLCHRDGTLKQMVAKDPKSYINEDSAIVPMLKMLQKSGRKTFLVTNSLWDYTNVVMNFLCGPSSVDSSCALDFDWLQYFDIVITGSAKPGFFLDENRAGLFEVDPESGMLLNTDNGTPMAQIGSITLNLPEKSLNKDCRVFQGGNVGHLHKLLSIESSSQVLYVGDHIYGDILRSKKVLGWRTMLVVPELEKEVELLLKIKDRRKNLQSLRNNRDKIEDKIHHLKWSLKFDDNAKENIDSEIETLEVERDRVRLKHQQALREWHKEFHGVWGQLMRTGYQNSRFAHQVERFACLYSSQVTNLGMYSPDKYYRPSEDFMPHDFDIFPL